MEHLKELVNNSALNPSSSQKSRVFDVRRRLGEEAIESMVAKYISGAQTTELMVEFSISKASVLKILREYNVPMRRQSMTTEQVEEAIVLYTQGNYSLKATAETLGLAKQSVRNALIKAGVEMRPSTRAPID
jgi:DNA invertase Pin-like site-specific DNA recombinase